MKNNCLHILVNKDIKSSVSEVIDDLHDFINSTSKTLYKDFLTIKSHETGYVQHWPYVFIEIYKENQIIESYMFELNDDTYVQTDYIDRHGVPQCRYIYTYENEFPLYEDKNEVMNIREEYRFKPINEIDEWDIRSINIIGIDQVPGIVRCKPINVSFSNFKEDMECLLNTFLIKQNGFVNAIIENPDRTIDFYYDKEIIDPYQTNPISVNFVNRLSIDMRQLGLDL